MYRRISRRLLQRSTNSRTRPVAGRSSSNFLDVQRNGVAYTQTSTAQPFPLSRLYPTLHLPRNHIQALRGFATDSGGDEKPQIDVQKFGDFPYGSREYKLVFHHPRVEDDEEMGPSSVASLRAHRNMIFGAQLFGETSQKRSLSEVCLPLLDAALEDASKEGEQPQAMATLHGLCDWVAAQCDDEEDGNKKENDKDETESEILSQLKTQSADNDDDLLAYHAVRAIATGIPRPGHSVVGQGTFRDGREAWEALATEFIEKQLAEEVELYKARGATVVAIEHLADTKPAYLRSAGGAMARLFFL